MRYLLKEYKLHNRNGIMIDYSYIIDYDITIKKSIYNTESFINRYHMLEYVTHDTENVNKTPWFEKGWFDDVFDTDVIIIGSKNDI